MTEDFSGIGRGKDVVEDQSDFWIGEKSFPVELQGVDKVYNLVLLAEVHAWQVLFHDTTVRVGSNGVTNS